MLIAMHKLHSAEVSIYLNIDLLTSLIHPVTLKSRLNNISTKFVAAGATGAILLLPS